MSPTRPLPKVEEVATSEKVVKQAVTQTVPLQVGIVTWQQRRDAMKGACLNCPAPPSWIYKHLRRPGDAL